MFFFLHIAAAVAVICTCGPCGDDSSAAARPLVRSLDRLLVVAATRRRSARPSPPSRRIARRFFAALSAPRARARVLPTPRLSLWRGAREQNVCSAQMFVAAVVARVHFFPAAAASLFYYDFLSRSRVCIRDYNAADDRGANRHA